MYLAVMNSEIGLTRLMSAWNHSMRFMHALCLEEHGGKTKY